MNISCKIPYIIFIVILLTAGAGCVTGADSSSPEYEIAWAGTPPAESKAIEMKIGQEVKPYSGAKYSNVTLSTSGNNDEAKVRIHVMAVSVSSRYPDLYDFTYRDGELIRVGYLLEAIPETVRSEAIGIAMQNENIAAAFAAGTTYSTPSVKRILPETAEKFYEPKTLLSVTWKDNSLSALVDVDTGQVVEVWSGN